MPLPDISRFPALDGTTWRSVGLRLWDIGLTSEYLRPVVEAGANLSPDLRLVVQRWHLRRMPGPAAFAACLLMFEDRLTEAEVHAALTQPFANAMLETGLIVGEDSTFSSPYRLSIADRIYVFSDDLAHGGDAVMGASESTVQLCRAAYPSGHSAKVLEIGCGAGTVALVLAQRAGCVVATDINTRALAIARVNAAVNGIANVEFRLGDAFEPVAEERFELIVSQPPYVARPERAPGASYLYGGRRGDELPLRLLGNVCEHLTARGRAVLLVQWPDIAGGPIEDRVLQAMKCDDARLLMLRYEPTDLDYQCATYASVEAEGEESAIEQRFAISRDHLDALGVRGLQTTLAVIQRDPQTAGWTAAIDVPPECADSVTSSQIDSLIATRDLAAADDDRLMRATLRPPEGIVFAKEYATEGAPKIIARLPQQSLGNTVELSEGSLLLISMVAEAPAVSPAVERFASKQQIEIGQAVEQVLPAIRQALRLGVLTPADSGQSQAATGDSKDDSGT